MRADKSSPASHGDELIVPFLFVPEGQSPPEDWLQAHPGAIRIPATLVLRRDGSIAGIKLAQGEGDTIAVPATPVSFAPAPGYAELETPASPLLSDVARQLLIMFGLENFSRAKPPAEGPLAAEPLKDDQGQQVFAPDHQRKKGEEERNVAVMRPAFMDPHFFVRKGIEDRKRDEEALKYAGESGMLLFALTYGLIDTNLFNFDHGGPWDAQRIAGHYYEKYVEYATIALGLYAAAYGIPEDKILELENMTANIDFLIALTEGRMSFPDREMDKIYRYLPEDNVKWTDIGYKLYKSGKISPNSKP